MLLSLRELEFREVRFDVAFEPGKIDLSESEFRQVEELRMSGMAEMVGGTDEVRIRGHVSGHLEGECHRCLEAARLVVDRDFDLYYRPADPNSGTPEMEIDEDESEIGFFEGSGLQLADVLREQVLLWLPMQWVCEPDCRGICPACGENRNKVSCGCREQPMDDRWASLRDYRPSTRK